jgi:flagellar hook-associated protein FlgK
MSFREQILGSSRSSLDTLANNFVKEVNAIHSAGVDAYGNTGGDLFTIDKSTVGSAGTVKVAFNDALKVSAAAQFRIIESPNNTGSADASIEFIGSPTTGPAPLGTLITNNSNASAALTIKSTASKPMAAVATIPNGLSDIGIFMGEADSGQQLQIFTRDGRQIGGTLLDSSMQD